jgi:hypothetical protein
MWLTGIASAQTFSNSTMTSSYQKLFWNDPIGAFFTAYTEQWGKWFYLVLILAPYFMMYIYHGQKLGLATIWLLFTLSAYETLVAGLTQDFVFYAVTLAWICSVLYKVTSPYTEK